MKKITFLLATLFLFLVVEAQKVYFIYLQSENQEPFYTRIGEKIHNSSSSGYLILSKLVDSTYGMFIGVKGSQSPEQSFSLTVNKKDQGYLIKNFGEKGWGLFNLQSFAIVMPALVNTVSLVKTEKRESNVFTDLLAKAADDSTIKERPVIVKVEEKKPDVMIPVVEKKQEVEIKTTDSVVVKPVTSDPPITLVEKPTAKIDSVSVIKEEKKVVVPIEKKPEVIKETKPVIETKVVEKTPGSVYQADIIKSEDNPKAEIFQRTSIIKRSESSTTEGFGITFHDVYKNGSIDTIKILIPLVKESPVVTSEKKQELKFLDISSSDTIAEVKVEKKEQATESNIKTEVITKTDQRSNNCLQNATEDDFFKLRKNMASETSNDGMINEAKKTFKAKCFSTEQIKYLSALFLSDESKYNFFDASYTFVTDIKSFPSLLAELKDEYYINRFKAMLY